MPLRQFWADVRRASNYAPPRPATESPRLAPEAVEALLRRSTGWLTPKTVAKFAEADFAFLPDPERARLAGLVTEFRRVAATVPPTAPPTEAQVAEGLPPLRDIILMLEFDRFGDAEAYRVGKQVELEIAPERPGGLAELRFETGSDSTGDPAIWILAVLRDGIYGTPAFAPTTRSIRDLLDEASRGVEPDRWPYIRFWTLSEQREILEGAIA